ncbi:hypothetical protein [Brevundimonas olei]|uniref:hypothetical protein n=1 Tax=Brevundimonas olei TaxID=657642 RepID=UPI0031E02BE4
MIELDLTDPNPDYTSLFDEYVEGEPFWLFRLGDSIFSTTVEDETIPLIVAGAERQGIISGKLF